MTAPRKNNHIPATYGQSPRFGTHCNPRQYQNAQALSCYCRSSDTTTNLPLIEMPGLHFCAGSTAPKSNHPDLPSSPASPRTQLASVVPPAPAHLRPVARSLPSVRPDALSSRSVVSCSVGVETCRWSTHRPYPNRACCPATSQSIPAERVCGDALRQIFATSWPPLASLGRSKRPKRSPTSRGPHLERANTGLRCATRRAVRQPSGCCGRYVRNLKNACGRSICSDSTSASEFPSARRQFSSLPQRREWPHCEIGLAPRRSLSPFPTAATGHAQPVTSEQRYGPRSGQRRLCRPWGVKICGL